MTLIAEPKPERSASATTLEGNNAIDGTQGEAKTYKSYDSRGIRTTIQLDADYVTMISPEVLAMPELWKRHTEILREKLSVLGSAQHLAWRSSGVIWTLSALPVLYTLATGGNSEYWLQWLSWTGSVGLIVLVRNRIIWWLAQATCTTAFQFVCFHISKKIGAISIDSNFSVR